MSTRDYSADGLTIHWDSSTCIHSGECVRALPNTFKPKERPWIDPDSATTDQLVAAIDRCPSRALTYTREGHPQMSQTPETSTVDITVTANGWLMVQGPTRILGADGSVIREGDKFFLCRCGQSNVKPFCDSSHKTCGFQDDGLGKKRDSV